MSRQKEIEDEIQRLKILIESQKQLFENWSGPLPDLNVHVNVLKLFLRSSLFETNKPTNRKRSFEQMQNDVQILLEKRDQNMQTDDIISTNDSITSEEMNISENEEQSSSSSFSEIGNNNTSLEEDFVEPIDVVGNGIEQNQSTALETIGTSNSQMETQVTPTKSSTVEQAKEGENNLNDVHSPINVNPGNEQNKSNENGGKNRVTVSRNILPPAKKKVKMDPKDMTILVNAIRDSLSKPEYCQELNSHWFAIWSFLDRNPKRCEQLISLGAIELMLECKNKYSTQSGLVELVLGVLANIAEAKGVSARLITNDLINWLYELLLHSPPFCTPKMNFIGAYILVHILIDEDALTAWTKINASRERILSRIRNQVIAWDVNSKEFLINLKFMSLKPFWMLLILRNMAECQLFGAWALAAFASTNIELCDEVLKKETEGWDLLLETTRAKPFNTTQTATTKYAKIAVAKVEEFWKNQQKTKTSQETK